MTLESSLPGNDFRSFDISSAVVETTRPGIAKYANANMVVDASEPGKDSNGGGKG